MTGCLPLPSIDKENAPEDPEHVDYLIAYYEDFEDILDNISSKNACTLILFNANGISEILYLLLPNNSISNRITTS